MLPFLNYSAMLDQYWEKKMHHSAQEVKYVNNKKKLYSIPLFKIPNTNIYSSCTQSYAGHATTSRPHTVI